MSYLHSRFTRAALAIMVASCLAGCFSPSPPYGELHQAAKDGDVETVKKWIREKRNLDVTYDDTGVTLETNSGKIRGLTPLMVAARAGHLEVVKLLVENGANIYAEARPAVQFGAPQHTLDVQSGYYDGYYPANAFDFAVEGYFGAGGHADVAEYLWNKSDRVQFAGKLALQLFSACIFACDGQSVASARGNLALFIAGITADDETLGNGIGLIACYWDGLPKLKFLASHGVRFPKNTLRCIGGRDGKGHFADPKARFATVQFLLDHGADPNAPPTRGFGATPLTLAASPLTLDLEMMSFLLAHGADPNLFDAAGLTPIMNAANMCTSDPNSAQLPVIELLVRAGARPEFSLKMTLLAECCARQPRSPAQSKICRLFHQT